MNGRQTYYLSGGHVELEFDGLGSFYSSPPALEDLIFESRDSRREKIQPSIGPAARGEKLRKAEMLIIVPSYHDHYRLGKLLAYLKRQSFRGFDVAVILAKDDEFVDGGDLALCQVKRKVDFGFAGSVYLGQLLALEGGYKYYLFTDVDRVPCDENVLQLLYDTAEKNQADFVYGNNMVKGYYFASGGFFNYKNPQVVKSNCVFGLIRASTLQKTGLYALPLYIGYEDVEFEYRLRKAMGSEAYLDRTIYESYSSSAKNAFLKNFGGDSMGYLYVYPTMVCLFGSPQTAHHLGLARMARMFFLVLLTQKFSALRIPALSALEKNARKRVFAKTHGSGISGEITVSKAENAIAVDYESYTANAPLGNSARILSAILSHSDGYKTSNYSPLFDFFIHDSFYVYDEGKKETLFFEWKRKPGIAAKALAFFSALLGTASAVFKAGCLDAAGNRGMFHKYGLGKADLGKNKK